MLFLLVLLISRFAFSINTKMLEKTVERLREELRKDKDDHKIEKTKRLKIQKTISDSYETVTQVLMMIIIDQHCIQFQSSYAMEPYLEKNCITLPPLVPV